MEVTGKMIHEAAAQISTTPYRAWEHVSKVAKKHYYGMADALNEKKGSLIEVSGLMIYEAAAQISAIPYREWTHGGSEEQKYFNDMAAILNVKMVVGDDAQPEQEEVKQMCPFCPLMGIDESLYEEVGNNFFGDPATIGNIPSCDACATVATMTDTADELVALLTQQA